MQLFFARILVVFTIFLSTFCTSFTGVTNEVSAKGVGNPANKTISAFAVVVDVPVFVIVQEQVLSFLQENNINEVKAIAIIFFILFLKLNCSVNIKLL